MHPLRILRKPDMRHKIGLCPSQVDNLEAAGLLPPRIFMSKRAVGWPEHEIDAVLAARVAGKSDDDVRALVKRIIAARARAFDSFEAA